jgi:hypothetical protein
MDVYAELREVKEDLSKCRQSLSTAHEAGIWAEREIEILRELCPDEVLKKVDARLEQERDQFQTGSVLSN